MFLTANLSVSCLSSSSHSASFDSSACSLSLPPARLAQVNRSKELTVGDQKEERPAKRRRKNKDDGEKEKGDGAAEGAGDAEEA